jgi:hypothetical protein
LHLAARRIRRPAAGCSQHTVRHTARPAGGGGGLGNGGHPSRHSGVRVIALTVRVAAQPAALRCGPPGVLRCVALRCGPPVLRPSTTPGGCRHSWRLPPGVQLPAGRLPISWRLPLAAQLYSAPLLAAADSRRLRRLSAGARAGSLRLPASAVIDPEPAPTLTYPPGSEVVCTQGRESGGSGFETRSGVIP